MVLNFGPIIAATATCLLAAGCNMFVPVYQYVLDKGEPDKITDWVLKQDDTRAIYDGEGALLSLMFHSQPQAKAAVEGYVRVYAQLCAGWQGRPLHRGYPVYMARLTEVSYSRVVKFIQERPDNHYFQELIARISQIRKARENDDSS